MANLNIRLRKPKPKDVAQMQILVAPEVARGIILPRSDDEVSTNIRSYIVAYICDEDKGTDELNLANLTSTGEQTQIQAHTASQSNLTNSDKQIQKINTEILSDQPKSNEKIIGFCALHIHTPELAEIRSLIVSEEARGHGIGSKMVERLLEEARHYELKSVFTLTYQRSFFERLGFYEIPKTQLPAQKIWADCAKCKLFPVCNEIALIYDL